MTKSTKTYQITTDYSVGQIRQTIRDVDATEAQQVTIQICDMQVQHALLALGWKQPPAVRLPRKTKTAKAAASLTGMKTTAP